MSTPAVPSLNSCQESALAKLQSHANIFLTGGAGTGKSFLIQHYLKGKSGDSLAVLASTGAAAILLEGRTFHSFFGLGILEGGPERTVEKAVANRQVVSRLRKVNEIIIDEISMLSGVTLSCAEKIARLARRKSVPWGGLKVIAVGDFAQLPPVSEGSFKDWAFSGTAWQASAFEPALLRTVMRTQDGPFLDVINHVRMGNTGPEVAGFLDSRMRKPPEDFEGTRLFALRARTEDYNLSRLAQLPGETKAFPTVYSGASQHVDKLRKTAPLPETLQLKDHALVMIRQNDPAGRWVNGSLGHIRGITDDILMISLLNGRLVEVEKASFHILDADGEKVASATNFPVNLAWATTIHKAQGATLDAMTVDLRNLWEPGHAYVALSRVRSSAGLYIEGWDPRSIKVDPKVVDFYRDLGAFAPQAGTGEFLKQ